METCNISVFISRFNAHVELSLPVKLTEKETILLRMLMHGMDVSQISQLRYRSAKTISHQKKSLYTKLGIENDISFWRDIILKYAPSIEIENKTYDIIENNHDKKNQIFTQNDIKNALKNNEFKPWLQPIICTKSRKIIGCEVLVRWLHPTLGLVMPEKFIDTLEDSEFILPFTKRMMHLVKQHLYKPNIYFPDQFIVCFNICENVINDLSIIDAYEDFIHSFHNVCVFFEITKGNRNQFPVKHEYREIINTLTKKGVNFSIADFDLSYAPYYTLSNHNIKMIKISNLLVSQIGISNKAEHIIETISNLSQRLNINICAKGVESVKQTRFLTNKGISLQQGHYFSAALPPDDFSTKLSYNCSNIII
ncbi:EAL domain-containing protein [Escherichia albertii]|uniref:EAL domain-containing protein n=1 Tax=Escherichia albertii TaxID=208962 RepID=UPI0011308497|nr:EAL domain-containing protein [Escherichia albertii]